ncbi:MAG: hypothetical protein V2J02_22075 [Pseudomonadales bacterium]|jgi:hypothetical protein|nr:hypothetical protein [Pseudomonadales bacterium]
MNRSRATFLATLCVIGLFSAEGAFAQQEDRWRFGVGTGISSFSLDGDIGVATSQGGVIDDIDLDNSETMDLIQSGIGGALFARKGPWTINLRVANFTLEDSDADVDYEWDNVLAESTVVYNFATTGNHRWGVLGGVRYIEHQWDITTATESLDPEDDWTDLVVGMTHAVPLAARWSWSNRVDYGFGESEGVWSAETSVNWQPFDHWLFNLGFTWFSAEFNDEGDVDQPDFYFYDVDQPAFRLGFLYLW